MVNLTCGALDAYILQLQEANNLLRVDLFKWINIWTSIPIRQIWELQFLLTPEKPAKGKGQATDIPVKEAAIG